MYAIRSYYDFFQPKIDLLLKTMKASPASTDSRENAMTYNDEMKIIFGIFAQKQHVLKTLKQPFNVEDYFILKNTFIMPEFQVNAYTKTGQNKAVGRITSYNVCYTKLLRHPHKTYLNFRNNLLMLYKNVPQKILSEILFWRKVLDYVAALQMMAQGKFENAKSVLQARKDFEAMMPQFEEKRNENILYATRSEFPTMLDKSIVKQFYFNSKKTYTKLRNNFV